MSNGGWVKVYRSLLEHWVSKDPITLKIWLTLLLKANHKPRKWLYRGHLYELKRGECMISCLEMATELGIHRSTFMGALDLLESDQQIVQQKDKRGTKVTILNYDRYQGNEEVGETTGCTTDCTTEQQQTVHAVYTNKNEKNYKNEKNNTGESDPNLHPSPNAPKHLKRKSQELKPYPSEDGSVFLTASEFEALKERWGEEEARFVIFSLELWSTENPKSFKEKIDHARTCVNFRARKHSEGKIFYVHPVTGPNYYRRFEVEQWTNQ